MVSEWVKTVDVTAGMAFAYRHKKSERTLEEAESDLKASVASHEIVNTALCDMAVQLSGAVRRNVELTEKARKLELKTNSAIDALSARLADAHLEKDAKAKELADAKATIATLEETILELRVRFNTPPSAAAT